MVGILLCVLASVAADADRGAVLAGVAGCTACHTAEGGAPYAGGYELETAFGTFYGTNLTPHPTAGIGSWTEADFVRAMRRGRRPDGHGYWPVFPFAAFSHLRDADVADLWAHLRTVAPDARENTPHAPTKPHWLLGGWRLLAFHPNRHPEPLGDPMRERGRYLVEVLGHCTDCHTPRTPLGTERKGQHLAGNDQPPHPGPNVTPHEDGLMAWTESDLRWFFEMGQTPDGDFVGGGMRHVIRDGTSKLPAVDRQAMAAYLLTLPALPDAVAKAPAP